MADKTGKAQETGVVITREMINMGAGDDPDAVKCLIQCLPEGLGFFVCCCCFGGGLQFKSGTEKFPAR